MARNSFRVPADILQKNVMRDDIRDLNAEFQKMGGVVQYRSTKRGGVFLLSHPNPDYLENFRVRLLYSLGLLKESEVPDSVKHLILKKGEVEEKVVKRKPAAEEIKRREPPKQREERVEKVERRAPKVVQRKHYVPPEIRPYYQHVRDSLERGAVDDGDIIRMAYEKNMDDEWIRVLKRLLWNNKCIAPPEECEHRKKKMRLEDMMKMCYEDGKPCEHLQSYFSDLYDIWKKNVDEMFGEFRDKKVEVIGKISEVYPIYRGRDSHFKMLIYDTLIRQAKKKGSYKKTRKVWIKVPFKDYMIFSKSKPFHIGDIIRFKGKMILHNYFHDYWVINIDSMYLVEEKGEEVIEVPKAKSAS